MQLQATLPLHTLAKLARKIVNSQSLFLKVPISLFKFQLSMRLCMNKPIFTCSLYA